MRLATATSHDGSPIEVHSIGNGPGVVILHGAAVSWSDYRRLANRLAERCAVHLYNRRGRPGSAPLRGDETASTDLEDLAAVLDATGATGVFGHSGGAFVAMQSGLSLPVERIAVYDPAVAVAGCDFPKGFLDEFEAALTAGEDARAIALLSRDINRDQLATKLPFPLQLLIVHGYLHTPIGRRMADLLPTAGPEVRRILAAEAPASAYAGITAKVLLARGTRSAGYYGPICAALAGAIPRARTIVLHRVSHNAANIASKAFARPFVEFFADE